MTPKQGAGVSFSVLLVALILAWQITKPEDRKLRPRVQPVLSPASLTESGPASRPRASRPASRVARRTRSRTEGPARIVGRVVTNRTRSPVTAAQVKIVFSYPGSARDVAWSAVTGSDGRFAAALPEGREPGSASLEVMDAKGFGKEDFDVFPPFAGTTDVGDVELSSLRKLWFHVTTADLAPIGEACAVGKPGPGVVVRTDAGGNGWIESGAAIEALRVAAAGFEPIELAVPPGEESLEVRLRPAVTAKIRVTTSAGEPGWGTISVNVETPPDAYLIAPGDPFWPTLGNTRPFARASRLKERPGGVPGDLVSFNNNPIVLGPLRQGTHLTILVTESFKARTFRKEVDLGIGPQDVDFVLPGDYGRLSGRVLDTAGKPVVGATVSLLKTPVQRATDANGDFSFGAVPCDLYSLQVSSRSHGRWLLADFRLEPDARRFAITMDAGVAVTVTVLDQDGMPFHGAAVSALDRSGRTDVKGRVKLEHLPLGLVRFEATSGGLLKVLDRHTSTPDVTLQLEPDEDR